MIKSNTGDIKTDLRPLAISVAKGEASDISPAAEAAILDDTLISLIHDLRSPLGAARLMIDMLLMKQSKAEPSDDIRRQLKMLQEALIKAERMVEDAAEIALIERHNVPLHMQSFSLKAMVDSCVEKVGHASFQRDSRFEFNVERSGLVRADLERSEAVLLRVLEDAILAGGTERSIKLTQERDAESVMLVIETLGNGDSTINKNRRNAALTVKSRLGSRKLGESRFSLVIAQEIMEQMGGLLVYSFGPPFRASIRWQSSKSTF